MKINSRQLSIIFFYLVVSLKYIALPSLIYKECESDSWMVFVLMAIFDIILISVVISFLKSAKEKTFYEFAKNRIGSFLAKTICLLFLGVFLLDILDATTGIYRLLLENYYNKFDWYLFLFPLISLVGFIVYKGLRNIGRVCEIFVWLIIAGLLFIIIKSIVKVEFFSFLPFLTKGISPVFKAFFKHISWFGTPIALLFTIGDVETKQLKKRDIVLYVGLAVMLIILLIFSFYGTFKNTSSMHSFALTDLSQISNESTAFDELSWFAVGLWTIAQILQISIFFYSAVCAMRQIFNINNSFIPIAIIEILMIIYSVVDSNIKNLENIFFSTPIIVYQLTVKLGIIVLLVVANFVFIKKKRKKRNAKT